MSALPDSVPDSAPAIAVRNLVKRYPKAQTNAVDDVSFSARRGEIFGLLGPNGAGKTTTIGVLTAGVVPTSGSATLMGIDVTRDPIRAKQRIAVMDHGKILVNDTSAELKKLIPGGNALELRVRVPDLVPAGADSAQSTGNDTSARLLAAIRALPGVSKVDEVDTSAPTTPAAGGNGGAWDGGAGGGGRGGWGGGGNGGGAWGGGAPSAPSAPEPERGVLTYRLYAEDANTLVGATAQAVLAVGAEVRDLHVKRPSLEDVFIYLTGRQLR